MSPSTIVDAAASQRAGEVLAPAAHEVVEDDDLAVGLAAVDQQVDDVRADEAGAAGDQNALVDVAMTSLLTFQCFRQSTPALAAAPRLTSLLLCRRHLREHRQRQHFVARRASDSGKSPGL